MLNLYALWQEGRPKLEKVRTMPSVDLFATPESVTSEASEDRFDMCQTN